MDKRVAIIMPCYNSERTVSRAINCIQRQSFKNWTLFVVDDGSTDSSFELINDIATADERIKIYQITNSRQAVARNYALKFCDGYDFVSFVDSDDFIYPDKLERQLLHMEKFPEVTVLGAARRNIDVNGKPIGYCVLPSDAA